jgi:signal transduction histidine kinase
LSAIKGQAQLLRRRLERGIAADDDRLRVGLDSIDAAATRMTSLIDELLDVAKLQAEQPLEMQREAVDLTALTRQMVEEVRRASGREAIEVRTEAPGLVGFWDSRQLGRVLENLLGNAVKYSPNGEPVDVAIVREERDGGAWAVLTVRDHGIGIPEADVPHVFERFHRGGNVGGIGGSGIGLAAARRIVVQHGGTIAVESREGEGSAFTVRLPLAPPMAG